MCIRDSLDPGQRDRREQVDRHHFCLTGQTVKAFNQEVGAGRDVALLDPLEEAGERTPDPMLALVGRDPEVACRGVEFDFGPGISPITGRL